MRRLTGGLVVKSLSECWLYGKSWIKSPVGWFQSPFLLLLQQFKAHNQTHSQVNPPG